MEFPQGDYLLTESTDQDVYSVLLQLGTATINQVARRLKRKHETISRAVLSLEEKGKVNIWKKGNVKYVSLRPDSTTKRVRPDSRKMEEKQGGNNEVYARTSYNSPITRAKMVSERVPLDGFVLHPDTRGADVGREWVRVHVNGEYQVKIDQVGDFKPYNRNDDVSIVWKTAYLNTNTAYNGKVFLKGTDNTAFSVRAVESKDGALGTLSVWIHPRYVYYKNHEATAYSEFTQQVKDVCQALEVHGWHFDYDSITICGELHTGINDPIIGAKVGRYNQTPSDSLHFDHSHGIPECEVYGSDPDTVELMVNLPEVIRSMSESLEMLTNLVNQIIEVQAKTVSIVMPKQDSQTNDVMFR